MYATGIFDRLLSKSREVMSRLSDVRQASNARAYSMESAGIGGLSLFLMQDPSFLHHQQRLEVGSSKSNFSSILGAKDSPSPNQTRNLLDPVHPDELHDLYDSSLQILKKEGALKQFTFLGDNSHLIALDGVTYHSSSKVHCNNCNSKTHKGETTYFHSMVASAIVSPNLNEAVALIPEFIVPQDGHKKQDCENAATKRWFLKHGLRYKSLNPTYLGDDLYSHQPVCAAVLEQGGNFIFVCKPDSHKTLYEYTQGIALDKHTVTQKKRHKSYIYQYKFMNQIPIKDGEDALLVNWFEVLEIDKKTKKILYKNSFITNHEIDKENIHQLAQAGRAKWKIENENNNTLKTKGYNFEHNYGHGKKNLSSIFASMTVIAFLHHTILSLTDMLYVKAREAQGSRQTFYNTVRSLIRFIRFKSWDDMMQFIFKPPDNLHASEINNQV